MSAAVAGSERTRLDVVRWPLCMLVVLVVHGVAMLRLREIKPAAVAVNAPPAVMLDLAPMPAPPTVSPAPPAPVVPEPPPPAVPQPAPPAVAEPPPPPPDPVPPEPAPALPDPLPPQPVPPDLALPRKAPPKPARHRPVARPPAVTPVTPPADVPPARPVQAAPPQAATAPGAASASWESAVAAYLARFKRYPITAQRHGEQGVALVRFSVDRTGMVRGIALARSSGHADLDAEAQSLVDRAQPLPKPPAETPGNAIELVVPVHFSLR